MRPAAPTLALAAALFASVFALRLAVRDPQALVTLLFTLPVALVAATGGLRSGLAAAAVAFALYEAWVILDSVPATPLNHGVRAGVFGVLGGLVGAYAERAARATAVQRDLYDNAPCGYHSLDAEGVFRDVNRTELDWLGYERAELVGRRRFAEFLTPASRALFERSFPEFKRRGAVHGLEFDLVRRDGTTLPVTLSATAITDESGRYLASRSTLFDATERRRADSAHRNLAALVESTADAIVGVAADGTVAAWNRGAAALFGVAAEDAVGRPIDFIVPGDRRAEQREIDAAVAAGRPVTDLETVRLNAGGDPLEVALTASPIAGETGAVIGASLVVRDVSARRRADQRFRGLLESAPDPMVIVAEGGRIELVNAACERAFGHDRSELLGAPIEVLIPERLRAAHGDMRRGYEREPVPRPMGVGRELLARHRDGSEFPVEISLAPLETESGTLITAAIRDVTARRQAETEVRAAMEEAHRANLAKSRFLSRMSHELRTPLNSILGFGQLLELDDLSPEARESADHIQKAGRHLLSMIDEILDIARIEAGEMAISLEPVELDEAIAEAADLVAPMASARSVRVRNDPAPTDARWVLADQQRLKQVLLNLLTNAVKYNREGGEVCVCASRRGDRVQVCVSDTGPGIRPEDADRLFEPFDRLGAERGFTEGTGLGLAVSRGFAEAMSGRLFLTGDGAGGSTFVLELGRSEELLEPPDGAPPEPGDDRTSADGRGSGTARTVLYVEDNVANFRLVDRVLRHAPGTRLLSAATGSLGLDLARQHRPDIVLLDLHLPGLTGQEVLRELKRDPATRDVRVVVLTADASTGEAERMLAAGAEQYLTKPLDIPRLLRIVAEEPTAT